jgi:transcriptional regulator GlxA family with amidase domain
VTTHHELLDELCALAPAARVQGNRVFVEDGCFRQQRRHHGRVSTSRCTLIAQELGDALASAVAQVMVVFHRRGGDDPRALATAGGAAATCHPAVHAVQNAVLDAPGQ